ncbi:major facilitator 4 family protein [Pyrobaculum oguniense TE7]|uniref:Major facilitator 4 family protein n=1 Tax=Pyrobaculum oguniense (strain DSM 13380 / JCM 10595 / TE7) TaxID=698757 RepID=H6QB34_PYROT|nr:major facilitator 4 family protein [Pyrobaculum oguniense TE7]
MRYLITLGLALITFASQAIWVTFSPVVTYVAKELGVSNEYVGYLAVLYPLLFLVLTVPSGILLDKNFKLWLTFGAIITSLGGFGRLIMPYNYYWLFICQLFAAIGQPFLLNAFVPFASKYYPQRRALVISILSLSMYLGIIFALATGYNLYTSGGITTLILPTATVSLVGLIIFILGAVRTTEIRNETRQNLIITYVISRRDIWLLGGILGLGIAVFDNLATWLQPALETVGLGKIAGEAVASAIIAGLVGILFIPSMISKRNIRTMYIRLIIPLIIIFFIIISTFQEKIVIYTLLTVSGLLMIPAYPVIMDWIAKFYKKEHQGSATGFVGLISRAISVMLMFIAPRFIYDVRLYFLFLTSSIFVAFVLSLLLPNDRKLSQSG